MSLISQKLISASGATEATDDDFNLVTQLYQFDGTNGAQNNTFLDSSSNAFSVTRSGSATQGTFSPFSSDEGKWSTEFSVSGTTNKLTLSSSADFAFGTGAFTIECWAYVTADTNPYSRVWHLGPYWNDNNSIGLVVNDTASSDKIAFCVYAAGGRTCISTNATPMNQWTHIACVRDSSGNFKLFVNGNLDATNTSYTSTDISPGGNQTFAIGNIVETNASLEAEACFEGRISNLRVVKGTALYSSSFTPSTSPLTDVTNTKLLTCCSNRFTDKSTSAHTIYTGNLPKIQPFSPFAPSAAYDPAVNGGSGYFSATADYASIAASSDFDVLSNGTFTIDFWFYRTDALGLYADYVGIFNGVSAGVLLYQYSTGFHVYINGSTVFNVTHPALNQWVHVALTRDGTTLRLALNGVLQASSTASLGTSNYPLNIAGDSTGRAGLQGYISDVRVVKGTRVYASNFTPPTAPSTAITNTEALLSFTNAAMFDQTGKSNIETVGNAQLNTSIKKFGTASAKFDESGDYLVVRNPIFLGGGDFTIEGFVYFNSSPTDGQGLFVYDSAVMGNRAGYGPALGTYANAPYQGKWHSYYGTQATPGTGTQGNSEATPSATTWIHFAYVRTSGVIKIFIGGSQIGSDIAWTGNYIANDVLTIAGYYSTSYLLNGYIDSYRVTLKARYTSNFTPPSEEFLNR